VINSVFMVYRERSTVAGVCRASPWRAKTVSAKP
jgi:hypothetical protein